MHRPHVVSNPFALMTHPQAVIAAVEASQRLRSLRSRVCRPLDKVGFGQPDATDDGADDAALAWTDAEPSAAAAGDAAGACEPVADLGAAPGTDSAA